MMKTSKSLLLFTLVALLIAGAIAYFGYRTLTHEALLRHYQHQRLAQSHSTQVSTLVMGLLESSGTHLGSLARYTPLDDATLKQLITQESNIDALWVLEKNHLRFPNPNAALTEKEKAWIQTITPLLNDPTQLYSHYFTDEQTRPTSGWYFSNTQSEPLLIYWQQRDNLLLGFKVPYATLLSEVINNLAFDYQPNTLRLLENGRLLYQSGNQALLDGQPPLTSQRLPYPLNDWQIDYYAQESDSGTLFLWGGLLLALVILLIGLVMLWLYREYTRTLRIAQQQVSFVGQVSHELKTPLTNITLYAEMLQELQPEAPPGRPDPQQRYLEVILSESQRLSRLIQNILSFTKAPKLHLQKVDLATQLSKISHVFTPAFRARNLQLILQLDTDISLITDVDRLTQIVSNFLSNAEKYAAQGKRVEMSATTEGDWVLIQVRDYGSGIAQKDLKVIFQPFYRVKNSLTEGVSGTGIGLTIARQLAESLRGEILVNSGPSGTCFTLKLPYTKDLLSNKEQYQ